MPVNEYKTKKLYYRRASWAILDKKAKVETLEQMLINAHQQLKTVGERTFAVNNSVQLRGAAFKNDDGCFVQISSFVPDEAAAIIDKNPKAIQSVISTYAALEGNNYVNGELFAYVKGNHVVLCGTASRETVALMYFKSILYKANIDHVSTTLSLDKVAQYSKLKMINDEGVKEIELNSSLYEASRMDLEGASGVYRSFADQLTAMFAKDKKLHEIKEKENLNVKLTISFDGNEARLKHHKKDPEYGIDGEERLRQLASLVIKDEQDDGFVIVTRDGNKITAEQIQISENQKIKTLGTSLSKTDAWDKLKSYYMKLSKNGALTQ